MASVPQEDYIRQLLDESFRTESDSKNIANDTPDEDEEDHIEVFQEDSGTEQEREDDEQDADNVNPYHSNKLNTYQVCLVILVKIHCTRPRNVRVPRQNIVIRLPGVKHYAKQVKTPINCRSLFFDEEMLNIIVTNTNLHIEEVSRTYSRQIRGKSTNNVEIKAVFGILYLAGHLKSSRLNTKELWTRDGCGVEKV